MDIKSIGRKVELSEIPAENFPRLKACFNSRHKAEHYVVQSDEEWAVVGEETSRDCLLSRNNSTARWQTISYAVSCSYMF